ncbi:ubiquinol-cytochrome c reductase iron-sulfur subunit [Vibrio tritonius]|uniref:Ubiquinol-cytochrome c reductase iron-sulfur subunit n=1 Tax=Vibrio tritonius TaxID=1435069 RepID=A0ABS7YTN5_9VIBR|nr:ubiquinol-cytochrome c reductase iron-sulfur subunit [Vibrio tritonius]MCA2018246.1 ubiquinol-cytochrome c reductase iron-sulfur subunit [Vibrio tritonius]
MSHESVDRLARRRFLTVSTSVVGALGVAAFSVPFIRAWQPSVTAQIAAAPVEVDISKIAEGQLIRVQWQGKPVWIVRRPPAMIEALKQADNRLLDPLSTQAQQPDYAQNPFRSIRPEIFVAVGICTHLGCSPTYLPNTLSEHVTGVQSGFFCPCHGSSFDMAGRVFAGGPAALNLAVPKYRYLSANRLLIGKDEGDNA